MWTPRVQQNASQSVFKPCPPTVQLKWWSLMTSMGSQNGFTLDEVSNGNGFKIGFEQAIRDRVRERFAGERFALETRTAGSSLLWPRIRRVFSRVFPRRCSSAGQRALSLHRAYNVIKFKQNKINFEKQRQHGLVLRSLTTERTLSNRDNWTENRPTATDYSRVWLWKAGFKMLISRWKAGFSTKSSFLEMELAKRLIISRGRLSSVSESERLEPPKLWVPIWLAKVSSKGSAVPKAASNLEVLT